MTIVRVRVDCVVEFLLKLECRARDTEAQEAVYNFDYAGIETRRSRIPTAHISPILTLNTPLKFFLFLWFLFFKRVMTLWSFVFKHSSMFYAAYFEQQPTEKIVFVKSGYILSFGFT